MNTNTIRNTIVAIAACGIALASISVYAGPDEFQMQMTRKLHEAKQKLQQAEAAKGAERKKLMEEHMKMMHETMGKMQEMKPKAGMSMQDHEEWINQHQKLMDEMMGQMMQEHHLLMGGDCMGSGNDHKH